MPTPPLIPTTNQMLMGLTGSERLRIQAKLELIQLASDEILQEVGEPIDYVFFPLNTVISLHSITAEGENVEVGMVGYEGVAGISGIIGCPQGSVSPYRMVVQLPGQALRMEVAAFHDEYLQNEQFHRRLLCFMHVLVTQMTQSAACNRFHKIEGRLCRWLLSICDRIKSNTLTITQESIANTLGVRRASVSEALGLLQKDNLIVGSRGVISITNRDGLEHLSCECYRLIKEKINELLLL